MKTISRWVRSHGYLIVADKGKYLYLEVISQITLLNFMTQEIRMEFICLI